MNKPQLKMDLNCDMGEMPEAIADGTQEALMRSITSANIACGGHAGDEETMRLTIEQALRFGVAVGAHPGYSDRENFGRLELKMPADEVANSVYEQVRALAEVANELRGSGGAREAAWRALQPGREESGAGGGNCGRCGAMEP